MLSYPHTFWHGTKAPVFIIDEANELNALKTQPNGHDAIHNLFKWLVINITHFHTILFTSSNCGWPTMLVHTDTKHLSHAICTTRGTTIKLEEDMNLQ